MANTEQEKIQILEGQIEINNLLLAVLFGFITVQHNNLFSDSQSDFLEYCEQRLKVLNGDERMELYLEQFFSNSKDIKETFSDFQN